MGMMIIALTATPHEVKKASMQWELNLAGTAKSKKQVFSRMVKENIPTLKSKNGELETADEEMTEVPNNIFFLSCEWQPCSQHLPS